MMNKNRQSTKGEKMDAISGCSTNKRDDFFPLVNLITGVNGQAGSYLAESLLSEGKKVVGIIRRSSTDTTKNIKHILGDENFELVEGDITDFGFLLSLFQKYKFSHIFNTAAQSHVHTSFNQPGLTWDVTAKGVLNILECMRILDCKSRFVQFSSSEMFGDQVEGHDEMWELGKEESYKIGGWQDENTVMNPQSPYGIAKLAAYNLVRLYRKSYGLFASNAILYNYDSPRRGDQFVTKKICKYIGDLHKKITFEKLKLGNLDAKRDWSYCPDSMQAVKMICDADYPDDFVVGTGCTYTVRAFVEAAFETVGLDWKEYVVIDDSLKRPSEVPYLRAKTTKIRTQLGWTSTTSFKELVKIMVEAEING